MQRRRCWSGWQSLSLVIRMETPIPQVSEHPLQDVVSILHWSGCDGCAPAAKFQQTSSLNSMMVYTYCKIDMHFWNRSPIKSADKNFEFVFKDLLSLPTPVKIILNFTPIPFRPFKHTLKIIINRPISVLFLSHEGGLSITRFVFMLLHSSGIYLIVKSPKLSIVSSIFLKFYSKIGLVILFTLTKTISSVDFLNAHR